MLEAMQDGEGHSGFVRRAVAALRRSRLRRGLIAVALTVAAGLAPVPASGQGWFDNLFQPFFPQASRPQPYQPARPLVRRPRPKPRPVVDRPAEKPTVPPSRFVLVVGDSLGQLLGQGLAEAFANEPEIGILRKARENTGLVRDDFFDWLKETREILDSGQKIDVAVMLIGSNDRQVIKDGGTSAELLSATWKEAYAARVKAIASVFAAHKVPLVWVSLPIVKSDRFAADMSGFNDIYRAQVAAAGATYVDIWEAFEDEKGQYSPFGPNVDGQIVRLRAADGVHFTKAGGRKLAHFVEADLRRLLDRDGTPAPAEAATLPANASAPSRDAVAARPEPAPAVVPVAGPILSLTGVPVAPDGALATKATAGPQQDATAAAVIDRALVQGRPVPARPGRADDHRWLQP